MQAHDRGRSLTVLAVSVIGEGLGSFLTLDGVFRDVLMWLPRLRRCLSLCAISSSSDSSQVL
jgi:hypothetical protein